MHIVFFFFKQKTAYEMRISDWSSDVCSSDLSSTLGIAVDDSRGAGLDHRHLRSHFSIGRSHFARANDDRGIGTFRSDFGSCRRREFPRVLHSPSRRQALVAKGVSHQRRHGRPRALGWWDLHRRSEEHTSELQSLMRISYAVFCLKKKTTI